MTDMSDMARFTELVEARGRTVERRRQMHTIRFFLLSITATGMIFTIFAWSSTSLSNSIFLGCWTIMGALASISATKDLLLCESILEAYDKVLIPEHKRN